MEQALGIAKSKLKIHPISDLSEAKDDPKLINVLDLKNIDVKKLRHGKVDRMPGKAAVEYIQKAVALAMDGKVSAIVTGPIHKEAINKAGFHYAGHTELLADLTETKDYAMILAHGDFRVSHVTTHTSMRRACDRIKKERVFTVIRLTYDFCAVSELKIPDRRRRSELPFREDGLFGDEEIKEISPAIKQAGKRDGMWTGRFPPTRFSPK